MKFATILAAMALAGSAFAIESSNIVGYQSKDIGSFNLTGTSFEKVATAQDVTFADYVVNCSDENPEADGWGANLDTLNTFTAGGSFDKQYIFCPAWLAEALTGEFGYSVTKGWYDVNDEAFTKNCNGMVVDFGTGILAKSASKGAAITFAGAVKNTPTVTDVGAFTIVANSSPVLIKLGDLIVNCDEEDPEANGWGANLDTVNTFTAGGSFDKQYIYCPTWLAEALTADFGYSVTKGWYDVNDEKFTENCNDKVTFAAGDGILMKSASVGATVTIKPAITK